MVSKTFKTALLLGLFANLLMSGAGLAAPVAPKSAMSTPKASAKAPAKSTTAKAASPKATAAPANSAPAAEEQLAPVLDPGQFFGAAAMGYSAAKANPHICSKLFCYCGCDITDSHKNLLDCFTSMHGVDCHICQEEALQALRMNRDGEKLADIQKNIDENYAHHYPFKEQSAALKKYLSTRLWSQPAGQALTKDADKAKSSDACCASKEMPEDCCAK